MQSRWQVAGKQRNLPRDDLCRLLLSRHPHEAAWADAVQRAALPSQLPRPHLPLAAWPVPAGVPYLPRRPRPDVAMVVLRVVLILASLALGPCGWGAYLAFEVVYQTNKHKAGAKGAGSGVPKI